MIKYRVLDLGLIIVLVLTGCISTKALVKKHPFELQSFDASNLEGEYEILSDTTNSNLWRLLFENHSFKKDATIFNDLSHVRLEIEQSGDLNVALIDSDAVINQFSLQGQRHGDFFITKRKLLLIPIPVFYLQREERLALGILENGDLAVVHGHVSFGFAIVMASGTKFTGTHRFKKTSN